MRLQCSKLLWTDFLNLNAVAHGTPVQLFQLRQLFPIGCDHDLPAYIMRNIICPAELHQRDVAISAIGGFQASRLVMDAGVNLTAIVPGLMMPPATLLLQDQNFGSEMPLSNRPSDRETDDALTNYRDVV